MEDVLNVQVPKRQALQIQHVRIFLKVTTLSDIVDHRGTSVITAMLYPAPAAQHAQHYQQNMSTLQWPQNHPLDLQHGMHGGTSSHGCTFNPAPSIYNTPSALGTQHTSKTTSGIG